MDLDWVLPLVTLTAMEIVLAIDNVVFLAVLVDRLEDRRQRQTARVAGLALALVGRVGLLLGVRWLMALDRPLFRLSSLPVVPDALARLHAVDDVTTRDLILVAGGLFLIAKSTREIHHGVEAEGGDHPRLATRSATLAGVLAQVVALDLVFSIDSVVSAVGMAQDVWIMIVAMAGAVLVMLAFAARVSRFVERHPTVKMLAMSFLVLIGVVLVAEGLGTHVPKAYIYFAMGFSLAVELLNLRARRARGIARAAPGTITAVAPVRNGAPTGRAT